MELQAYIDEIRLKLTGYVLDMELSDDVITKTINSAFREIQRYIDITALETIPYSKCIDLSPRKINAVARVFRSTGFTNSSDTMSGMMDPLYVSQWQILSGTGNLYNFQDYMANYGAWNTSLQIRNTISTDMAFRYDRNTNKLYINVSCGVPDTVTVEYVPRFDEVQEIKSDFWIDMIMQLSIALIKVILGRIRSRFTQNNALWSQDGEKLLEEGNTELAAIRQSLVASTQLCYPID